MPRRCRQSVFEMKDGRALSCRGHEHDRATCYPRGSGKRRPLFPTVVLPVFPLLFTLSKSLMPRGEYRYVVDSASLFFWKISLFFRRGAWSQTRNPLAPSESSLTPGPEPGGIVMEISRFPCKRLLRDRVKARGKDDRLGGGLYIRPLVWSVASVRPPPFARARADRHPPKAPCYRVAPGRRQGLGFAALYDGTVPRDVEIERSGRCRLGCYAASTA